MSSNKLDFKPNNDQSKLIMKNILYLCSEERTSEIEQALLALGATSYAPLIKSVRHTFILEHRFMRGLKVRIDIINDLDAFYPHYQTLPIDLFIYDDQGLKVYPFESAFKKLSKKIKLECEKNGPDMFFPLSRVALIKKAQYISQITRELSQWPIKDTILNPKGFVSIIHWIRRLLLENQSDKDPKISIALSGGGLEGFLFQLGATHALSKIIKDNKVYEADIYSGVSSGSMVSTLLANKVPTIDIIKALHGKSSNVPTFKSKHLFDIAGLKILSRFLQVNLKPNLLSPTKFIQQTLKSIPTGFFKGDQIKNYFEKILLDCPAQNQFSKLDCKLFIGATDQDSFEHKIFGKSNSIDVPISEALRASISVPPFFVPHNINGRRYIDGQITNSCNIETVIQSGAKLIIIVDPMQAYKSITVGGNDKNGGAFAILQTIKALVQSNFEKNYYHLRERYPDIDFLIVQPDKECAFEMAGSPMRLNIRTKVIDLAFDHTIDQIKERYNHYKNLLEKYGLVLKQLPEIDRTQEHFQKQLSQL